MDIGTLAIWLIVVVAIIGIVIWFVSYSGVWPKIPHPFKIVIYAVVAIVAILFLLGLVGHGPLVLR